jgi:hypothetical protein
MRHRERERDGRECKAAALEVLAEQGCVGLDRRRRCRRRIQHRQPVQHPGRDHTLVRRQRLV